MWRKKIASWQIEFSGYHIVIFFCTGMLKDMTKMNVPTKCRGAVGYNVNVDSIWETAKHFEPRACESHDPVNSICRAETNLGQMKIQFSYADYCPRNFLEIRVMKELLVRMVT